MNLKNKYHSLTGLALAVGLAIAGITGCNDKEAKVKTPQTEMTAADEKLKLSLQEAKDEYRQFKEAAEETLKDNQTKILALREDMKQERKEIQEKYSNELRDLELKNSELKEKMADFKKDSTSRWEDFKSSFNKQLEELGQAVARITSRDKEEK